MHHLYHENQPRVSHRSNYKATRNMSNHKLGRNYQELSYRMSYHKLGNYEATILCTFAINCSTFLTPLVYLLSDSYSLFAIMNNDKISRKNVDNIYSALTQPKLNRMVIEYELGPSDRATLPGLTRHIRDPPRVKWAFTPKSWKQVSASTRPNF